MPGLLYTDSYTGIATPTSMAITGLEFAGNTEWTGTGPSVSPEPSFYWPTPPMLWPGSTYIWRSRPVRQPNNGGYWTCFFHAQDSGDGNHEYSNYREMGGGHPYPDPPEHGTPRWELVGSNADVLGAEVEYDRWYQHVLEFGTDYLMKFWVDWPSTEDGYFLQFQNNAGLPDAPNRILIVAGAPWRVGGEVFSGVMRAFQFYDELLSSADKTAEIAEPGSVLTPVYLNLNPTPDDISDKSGNGNHPQWRSSDRPTLWEGP